MGKCNRIPTGRVGRKGKRDGCDEAVSQHQDGRRAVCYTDGLHSKRSIHAAGVNRGAIDDGSRASKKCSILSVDEEQGLAKVDGTGDMRSRGHEITQTSIPRRKERDNSGCN